MAASLISLIGKTVTIIALFAIAGCGAAWVGGMAVDLATHSAQPDVDSTPPALVEMCERDAGAFIHSTIDPVDGYLELPPVIIGRDGAEKHNSTFTGRRWRFDTETPPSVFKYPYPMKESPSPKDLRFFEGYNPPFQDLEPRRIKQLDGKIEEYLPDQNAYYSGYVRKEMVERPSPLCEEQDAIAPPRRGSNSSHCISFTRSDAPTAEYAVQDTRQEILRIPVGGDSSYTVIFRNRNRIFHIESNETIAERIEYSHLRRYMATNLWKGELISETSTFLASCGTRSSRLPPNPTDEEWSNTGLYQVLGINSR